MRPLVAGVSSALLMVLSNVAAASEAAEKPPSLFSGNVGNAIWTLVIFTVLLVVLGKFAWGPILRSLQKREQFIRDSLDQARKERDDAAQLLKQYQEQLRQAEHEAQAVIQQGHRDAQAVSRQIVADARTEANRTIEQARREIGLARDQAIKDLYAQAASLATAVAEQIVKRELRSEEHWALIQESLAQLEAAAQPER
jgi:F-type H+-transporting ATPase subunit b